MAKPATVKALFATSRWAAELPARFVLFFVVRLASRRGVLAWPQRTSGKNKAGSNEQPQRPVDQLPHMLLRSDSAGRRQQAHYTTDATSVGIPQHLQQAEVHRNAWWG